MVIIVVEVAVPLESLDFNLLALFLWIKLVLAALSRAEKTADKFLADLAALAFFIKALKVSSRFLLRAVLNLSFLTFFIADLIIGISLLRASTRSSYNWHGRYSNTPCLKLQEF